MTLDERVTERLVQSHSRYPPFSVLFAANILCHGLGEQPEAVEDTFVEMFSAIFRYVPDVYKITSEELLEQNKRWPEERHQVPTVPLHDILTSPGNAINSIMVAVCYNQALVEHALLAGLRKKIFENEADAHGLSVYERRKKKIPAPWEHDKPPEELCKMYLRGTPFLDLFNTQVPFTIPRDRWATHAIILAPSEWGKSELTGLYLREALEDPESRAIFLLDPHGDLFRKALPRVPPERLVVIDPDKNPPDLNILDYGVLSERTARETFKFLMSSLAGGLSPKQETCINPLFALLKQIDGANLVTLHDIITENARSAAKSSFAEPISRLDDIPRKFFENLWYTGNFSETRDALQWKLSAALSEPAFKKMFSATRNSIDVWRFIEERKVVLVKGGEAALGKEGMRLFLLFLIGQYYAAGKRREAIPEHKRHLAMMFVDEASNVLQSPIIADILIELRKYQCAFIAATQLWAHIAQDVRPAVLGSTGMRIVGKLGHDETMVLARDMETTPETIKNLKNIPRSHAEWCCYVRSVTPKAVVVTAPYGVLEGMAKRARAVEPAEAAPASQAPGPVPAAQPVASEEPVGATEPLIKPGKDWE
jgi:hypothetical protein